LSLAQTVLLGAIAGFTIFIGLPVGRAELKDQRVRVGLAMFSVGVLAFIFVDVFEHGFEILEKPVADHHIGKAVPLALLLGAGFLAGTAGIAWIERRLRPQGSPRPPLAGADAAAIALAPTALDALTSEAAHARRTALRTGLVIASAIGLHNFAEGLAIGVSAQAGEIGLATVLIIGFALHNATEGFGIVGPLAGVRPSWRWLGLAGLIGGGPTFVGSLVGYQVSSQPLELAFYALAGGAIIYAIGEIWHGVRRYGHKELALVLLTVGFLAGVLTDMVVVYGGA
jgi:ZIP family zinc transporter